MGDCGYTAKEGGGIMTKHILLGLLGIFLIILGPLGFIWAVNTLFGLTIGYTLKTWAAAGILAVFAAPNKVD